MPDNSRLTEADIQEMLSELEPSTTEGSEDDGLETAAIADNEEEQDESETEDDVSKEPSPPTNEDEEGTGAEDDEDSFYSYELDPSITDPIAIKRWKEQRDGLRKIETRLLKKEALVENQAEAVQGLASIAQELQDPLKFKETLHKIIAAVAQQHKTTPEELVGYRIQDESLELDDYDQKLVLKAKAEAKAEALREIEAKYGHIFRESEEKERERKEEQAIESKAKEVFVRTRDKVAKTNDGFTITQENLVQAIKSHPTLDPYKAVLAEYSEKIINHRIHRAKNKKGPEVHKTAEPANKATDLRTASQKERLAELQRLAESL